MLKYLKTKNRAKLLVKQAPSIGHVTNPIRTNPIKLPWTVPPCLVHRMTCLQDRRIESLISWLHTSHINNIHCGGRNRLFVYTVEGSNSAWEIHQQYIKMYQAIQFKKSNQMV